MSRNRLRSGILTSAVLSLCAVNCGAQLSAAWQSYAANPDAHPNIPNVSYAGYESGTSPLPTTADGRMIVNVSTFGASPDDGIDDTEQIRNAVAIAGAFSASHAIGAALVFEPGEYILSGPVFVHSDKLILAGAGRDQTTLRFTKSLDESHAHYPFWGYSGGMIWFIHPSRETYRTGVPTITSLSTSWSTGSPSSSLTSTALLGDRQITVSNASQFSQGDYVFIQVDNDDDLSTLRHLFGDGVWANGYTFTAQNDDAILPSTRSVIRSMYRIQSKSGNTITFEEPLKFDARMAWSPQVRTPTNVLRNVGIRDLTIRMDRTYTWTDANHNLEPGYNGVCMNAVINGFVENVAFRNTDGVAVNVNGGKHITIRDVDIGADTEALRTMHHAFFIANSFDALIEDFVVDAIPRHGLYFGGLTMGSVYSRGIAMGGTFDYHKILPYANAITEVSIVNTGRAGGDSDSGPPMGARHAHWNVDTLGTGGRMVAQPDIMPRGALVGVRCTPTGQTLNTFAGESEAVVEGSGRDGFTPNPPNLYEAQFALRLGNPLPPASTDGPCESCGPDDVYTFNFGAQLGQDLGGQDNWVLSRDFTGAGVVASMQVDSSHPSGPVVTPIGVQGREGIYSRQNNPDFGFTPPNYDGQNVEITFDLRSGGSTGSGDALLIVNNAYEEGIQFGIVNNTTFLVRGGRFSSILQETTSIPSGWYSRGEWAQLRLTLDFTANSGLGSCTVAFKNLSRGETSFTNVPAFTNLSMEGVVVYPETWDRIEFRMDDEAALTNIAINVDPSDDFACCEMDLAEPFGTLDFLDAVRFYQAYEAGETVADWNGDGNITPDDAVAYQTAFEAGCP
ncbi:MAG: hypothetical protein KDA31_06950 [Phycisphaerales bacterium]|nr:hypothetical protein [Phycisphaerales bacterium]MCB9837136.1 hypothetical protein [Phycisphaera sp.]